MLAKLLQNWVCRKVKLRGESDRIWGGGDWTLGGWVKYCGIAPIWEEERLLWVFMEYLHFSEPCRHIGELRIGIQWKI